MLNLLFMTLRSGASPALNIYYRTSFFVHGIAGAALLPVQFHAPCNTSLYNLHMESKRVCAKYLTKYRISDIIALHLRECSISRGGAVR